MAKETKPLKISVVKSPDYKLVYSTGVFGSLAPTEGRMIFYVDRPVPIMKDTPLGSMEVGELERELQVEIHMPLAQWVSMAEWMQGHISSLKQKGILETSSTEKSE